MTHRTYNALLPRAGNSARSILAEAILNRLGEGRFPTYGDRPSLRTRLHEIGKTDPPVEEEG